MRAAVTTRYGPPSVVQIREVPDPIPGAGEILVRVTRTTVNRTDCGFRAPHPWFVRLVAGLREPAHPVNGSEFAGEVAALGPGVTTFAVGDRVFGFREQEFGAHAQYLTIAADDAVAATPPGVSDDLAAASTEASQYALSSLRAGRISRDSRVLVYGSTGAIGSAAVQFLTSRGVATTAVCDGVHAELMTDLGADRIIDRTSEDFTQDEGRYDVVFDAVGKSSFRACRPLLTPRGTYLTTDLGPLSQNPPLTLATAASSGRRAVLALPPRRDQAFARFIASELASGRFRPVIDRHYPLDRIVEAYEYVESGQKIGNVVVGVGTT